jgi:WD40 repeat protein
MRLAPQRLANVYHRFSGFYYTVWTFACDLFLHSIHIANSIWDVENKRKQKTVIVVKSKERGARTKVTACGYSPDGRYIAGGTLHRTKTTYTTPIIRPACLDGALHLWKTNSNFVRPDMTAQDAHVKGTETGSLTFSVDGSTILTRGGDHTVKRTFHVRCLACCSQHPQYGTFVHSSGLSLRGQRFPHCTPPQMRYLAPITNML